MAQNEKAYANPGLNEEGGKNLNYIMQNSDFFKSASDDEEKGELIAADIFRVAVAIALSRGSKIPDSVGTTGSSDKRPNGRSWTQLTLNSRPKKKGESNKTQTLDQMIEVLSEHSSAKEETWGLIERAAHAGLEEMVKDIEQKKLLSEMFDC